MVDAITRLFGISQEIITHQDLDDEDINAAYVPSKSTASKKLAAVAKLPRGAAAICILTFGITLVGGLVLTSLFSATSAAGGHGAVAHNKVVSSGDWAKTARVARHIDKQVDAVQNMEEELSHLGDMQTGNGGRGQSGARRSRRGGAGGGGNSMFVSGGNDMPYLDPVQPMQQYDAFKQDYSRQQQRQRRARKSSGGTLSAAMQSYIDEAASFIDPSVSKN